MKNPTHENWDVGFERTPSVRFDGLSARISDVRSFRYNCGQGHEPNWVDREIDCRDTISVDFIVVPFASKPDLAHTMVSFGFSDGSYLAISVEARRRQDQPYSLWKGLIGAYPLMYVIADENDCIGERIECRRDSVHLYQSAATPQQSQTLLMAMLRRADGLSSTPEKYNTLFNNCLTNLRDHVNEVWPGRIPWGWGMLFTGHADRLAYKLGILKSSESFATLHEQSDITELAAGNWHDEDFSRLIRARQTSSMPRCLA